MNIRQRYARLAPFYDAFDIFERLYKRRLRSQIFAGLGGLILDAGAGTGPNVAFYPDGARVLAIDLSPEMLVRARRRCDRLDKSADLAAMDILRMGFRDSTFDAVVAAFIFCVLDETMQAPALAELARVCKPGGEIRILDYTVSPRVLPRMGTALWQPWQNLVYGGTFDRHTERYLIPAGLALRREERMLQDTVRILYTQAAG